MHVMELTAEASPRRTASLAGFLYLIVIAAAPFAQFVARSALIVRGDAAATAYNILASESLYRLGGAADLIVFACDIVLAVLFYELLKPAGRGIGLLAAFFRLAHAAVAGANTLNHFAPLLLLGGAGYLGAFTLDQTQALALTFTRLHATGYNIALVFFGFHCLLTGYLISRSTFLPKIFGGLMALAGLCYLANSFASLLAPALASRLFPWILLPGLPAEGGLALWLLVAGVAVQRWKEQKEQASV